MSHDESSKCFSRDSPASGVVESVSAGHFNADGQIAEPGASAQRLISPISRYALASGFVANVARHATCITQNRKTGG
jgi:hypothetical protein